MTRNLTTFKTLNVGCGKDQWGDVRLDIKREFSPTVIADAQNLPFREKSFKVTKAMNVLEHLNEPSRAIKQLIDITGEKLIMSFPTEWDVIPHIMSSFISLNWRVIPYYTRYRTLRWHKWIIKREVVVKFLTERGWRCTTKKGRYHVFNILGSRRLPSRIRSWIRFSPLVTDAYIIEAQYNSHEKR